MFHSFYYDSALHRVIYVIIYVFPGIFAYLNYLVPAKRQQVLDILITGLQRLEYRGYDSAGESESF